MSARSAALAAPRPWRVVAFSLAAAVLAAALGAVVHEVRSRQVVLVKVTGHLRHTDRSALEEAVASKVSGSLYQIDVSAVREAALRLPWVRDVSVRRVWPDSLYIGVTEREPVARWKRQGLLEADAALFQPARSESLPSLPLLDGPEGTEIEVLDRYRALSEGLSPLGWRVRHLSMNARHAWRAELENGVVLLLGRSDGRDEVKRLVRAFDSVLVARPAALERIDLRYTNGFAVRWKQRPAMQAGEGQG